MTGDLVTTVLAVLILGSFSGTLQWLAHDHLPFPQTTAGFTCGMLSCLVMASLCLIVSRLEPLREMLLPAWALGAMAIAIIGLLEAIGKGPGNTWHNVLSYIVGSLICLIPTCIGFILVAGQVNGVLASFVFGGVWGVTAAWVFLFHFLDYLGQIVLHENLIGEKDNNRGE